MESLAIDATIGQIASCAIQSVGSLILPALIPSRVEQGLFSAIPDAIEFGGSVSGTLPGKYFGLGGGGGIEALISPKTGNSALYWYAGGTVNIRQTNAGIGASASAGLVFDTPTSKDYTRWFVTISVPFTTLPPAIQERVENLLEIYVAHLPAPTSSVIQNLINNSFIPNGILQNSTANIFFDPTGGGSFGISYSYNASSSGSSSNMSGSLSFYRQLLPSGHKVVPFR